MKIKRMYSGICEEGIIYIYRFVQLVFKTLFMIQPWKWLIGSLHFYSLRHEDILNVATAVKPCF